MANLQKPLRPPIDSPSTHPLPDRCSTDVICCLGGCPGEEAPMAHKVITGCISLHLTSKGVEEAIEARLYRRGPRGSSLKSEVMPYIQYMYRFFSSLGI
uniref:Uncharacterized protein n=1 Tax=Leersia perrieri TaxID=77586 RepID=A0A0D9W3B0_9ORYZ